MLIADRAEAAIERLNFLLEDSKLKPVQEGAVRMMLAQALEMAQRQKGISVPENHQAIIEQTRRAVGLGIEADAAARREWPKVTRRWASRPRRSGSTRSCSGSTPLTR